jgi:hypothetical protein
MIMQNTCGISAANFRFEKVSLGTSEINDRSGASCWPGEFPIDCPLQDSVMSIHYKGMLLEGGKIFYNTRTDNPGGEPLEFASGEGAVRGYAFHFELYLGILLN